MYYLGQRQTFLLLTVVFFIWGVIGGLNDVLVPHLKHVFNLSYAQAILVQFVFFTGYLLVSIPASQLINWRGLPFGIAIGLLLIALGALMFTPATIWLSYPMFLAALFVIAMGITFLQVSANTYVSTLGNRETSSSRLNLAQGFQSLGAWLAPILGGYFILSSLSLDSNQSIADSVSSLRYVYIAIAMFLLVGLYFFNRLKLTPPNQAIQTTGVTIKEALFLLVKQKKLTFGAIAIFVYVGAEVSIGSFLISFLLEVSPQKIIPEQAAYHASLYFMAMLIGRFLGAWLMRFFKAKTLVKVLACIAFMLCFVVSQANGAIAIVAIVAIGFCNSIMFPTIFTLAISDLGKLTSKGAGVLCLAIFGGAVIPLVQGLFADVWSLQLSFLIPSLCFAYVFLYVRHYDYF